MIWSATGPHFHYNDTPQMIIGTPMAIIAFLTFVIQNIQNQDNGILHIKVNELLRATK